MDVKGQVALVTGGASGLGFAAASRLADRGAKVVLLDLASSAGEQAAAEIGNGASFVAADVTDEASVRAAVDFASEVGDLRVLVNCAGIGAGHRTIGRDGEPFPLDLFERTIRINLIGTFNVIRLAAARMATVAPLGEERGVIINTASVAAFDGQVGQAAYSASKGGVVGMTLPIARDLASSLIRVMTVAPGTFDTPMMKTVPDEIRASLGKQVPHPSRLGDPDEFGLLVADIVHNPMLNGETIRLDGAIRMAPR